MTSKQTAERMMKYWAAQYQALAKYPDQDPCQDGDVIRFSWRSLTKVYEYAAIRVNGLWYTTGPMSPKCYSWDQLVAWMADNVAEIYLMKVDRRIVPADDCPNDIDIVTRGTREEYVYPPDFDE